MSIAAKCTCHKSFSGLCDGREECEQAIKGDSLATQRTQAEIDDMVFDLLMKIGEQSKQVLTP